jgi:hypothetical protein
MNEMRRPGASLKTGEHRDAREQVPEQSNAAPPHLEAHTTSRAGGRGASGMPENLVQDAYLRVVRFFDGSHVDNAIGWTLMIGHNTWFTNGNEGARSPTAPP